MDQTSKFAPPAPAVVAKAETVAIVVLPIDETCMAQSSKQPKIQLPITSDPLPELTGPAISTRIFRIFARQPPRFREKKAREWVGNPLRAA